jgi:hypothetical protein
MGLLVLTGVKRLQVVALLDYAEAQGRQVARQWERIVGPCD